MGSALHCSDIANAFKEDAVDKENCLQVLQTKTKERGEVAYSLIVKKREFVFCF